MKKVLSILLIIIIFISLIVGIFYHMLVFSPERYQAKQNNYFSKVEYSFTGRVTQFEYLGGVYALIYIKPSIVEIKKNTINQHDDFAGLYSRKDDLIVLFANFDLLMNNKYDSLEKNKIENVNIDIKVNSLKQKIYFLHAGSLIGETYLVPTGVYSKKIMKVEQKMNKTIRF